MTTKRRRKGEGALVERKDAKGKITGYAAILDLGWVGGKRQRDGSEAIPSVKSLIG